MHLNMKHFAFWVSERFQYHDDHVALQSSLRVPQREGLKTPSAVGGRATDKVVRRVCK